ncbi:unnamed protein product [Arabis nemorensis]|uniref:Protein kinase domain-containing protein n=1 Tax=Arabis nemorensis TaxID=586526 RepID=A0A565BYQ0_9BRAS|nr:unnamed protein product [Arabis nemorensis]
MFLSDMERVGEEIVASNSIQVKELASNVVLFKLDGQVLTQEFGLARNDDPSRSDFPGSSVHRKDDAGSGVSVEELTLGKFRNPVSGLRSNIDSFKAGKFDHLSGLAKGFGFGGVDEELRSRPPDMDQMLSRIRQQLSRAPLERQNLRPDQPLDAVSGRLRVAGGSDKSNKDASALTSGDVHLETPLSSSNFSQLISKRALKGKEIVGKKPETHLEFGFDKDLGRSKEERLDHKLPTTHNVSTLKALHEENMTVLCSADGDYPKLYPQEISLREYLRSGNIKREKLRGLLLFRQLVELVDSAHSQGFFLQDLRPSFLSVSPSDKLRYIGSSGKNDSDWDANEVSNRKRTLSQESSTVDRDLKQRKVGGHLHLPSSRLQVTTTQRPGTKTSPMIDLNAIDEQDQNCYELHQQNHFSHLGASVTPIKQCISSELWLEKLWYACPEEQGINNNRFKSNIYSLGVLLFELLCDCESTEMYTAMMADLGRRILPPTFFSQNTKEAGFLFWLLHPEPSSRPTAREILQSELLCKENSVSSAGDDEEVPELLLHFLASLEKQKQKHASKLLQDIQTIEEDIKEAERRYSSNTSLTIPRGASERRFQSSQANGSCDTISNTPFVPTDRLINNIRQIEDAYFFMRSQMNVPGSAKSARSDKSVLKDRDMCKFETCGTIRSGDLLNSTGLICSLSFDPDEEHIAAAGISKKIKIFDFDAFMDDSVGVHYPLVEMCNKTKLSCVCWNSYIKNYLASTDYDGVVQIWDAGTGQGFSQYAEHQKRAWSVDFSPSDPTRFVSGSDDCSVKLWSINDKRSTGTIRSPANVCCVQFSGSSSHLLAFGSADYKVYCYDLRYVKTPWCTLAGHEKAVSYVEFMDSETIVSASTDNSLKLWNLNKTYSSGLSSGACSSTYKGHTNQKNFVGLSVLNGYIACGSETNEVYNYYRSLPMPMTSHKFGSVDPISGNESYDDNGQFVSSVCWRKKSNMLVAASSTGTMKLLKLV